MKKKISLIFSWLLVGLFVISSTVVHAADTITLEKFVEIMKEKGYETSSDDEEEYASARKKIDDDIGIYFSLDIYRGNLPELKSDLSQQCDEVKEEKKDGDVDSYKCVNTEADTEEDYGYIEYTGKDDDVDMYGIIYRKGEAVVHVFGPASEKSEIKSILKDLGFIESGVNFATIVLVVVALIVIGGVVYFIFRKSNNQGNANNQGVNFGLPINQRN